MGKTHHLGHFPPIQSGPPTGGIRGPCNDVVSGGGAGKDHAGTDRPGAPPFNGTYPERPPSGKTFTGNDPPGVTPLTALAPLPVKTTPAVTPPPGVGSLPSRRPRRRNINWCPPAHTVRHAGGAGPANLPLYPPPPPNARRCRALWWGGVKTNRAKDRADAQRLVTTRLLDRLHDPLGHFSRLQRIYPRAR